MKRSKKSIMVTGLILLLIALWFAFFYNPYTNYDLLYQGESESWTAECSVKGKARWIKEDGSFKYDSYQKRELTVTYKGDVSELANTKYLKIDYNFLNMGSGFHDSYNNDIQLKEKTFRLEDEDHGKVFPTEGYVFHAKISLDGKEQIIELRSK